MATLTGTKIANTYKQLLQVGSSNTGLTGSVQTIQDGQGNNSPLQLSQSAVNINGTFQLSGVTLTANASTLNAVADLTGATGIVAVSAGNVYGRTITGGTGVSITNADGTEGNPTIALNTTGVVSASYGPATNIEVNAVGQIVSAGAATSVSVSGVTANTFTGGTFAGTTGDFSSNVSVGGNLTVGGEFTPAALSVTGTINAATVSATDGTFNNIVSAAFFVGDGSGLINVPSAEGGTVKFITAGTGIKLTVDAAVTTTIPVSGTVAVSSNQNFGTVSVSTALAVTGSALFGIVSATNIDTDELLIAGVSAATVTEVAAVSALTQTNLDSITSINTVVGNVSAVTSVNAAAITSINTIIGDGSNFATSAELAATSLALATSINTANTRITSVSDFAVALSATLATSIGTANTRITSVSDFAVALSATLATSIGTANTRITSVSDFAVALSATLATSIGNSNTNITTNTDAITSINIVVANVSALTSVNAAAITSINAVIEGNVSADSGTFNTLTVVTSASVGGTLNVGNGLTTAAINGGQLAGFRNRIINGNFAINQRVYSSGSTLSSGTYGHDRWKAGASGGDYSFTQSANGCTITIAAGKTLIQVVEGANLEGGTYVLSWSGTAQARYAVNSSTPSGTYASSPITITGQSASLGMSVEFDDGTLSGVQLELNSTATPFEQRGITTELSLCQRYFCKTFPQSVAPANGLGTAYFLGYSPNTANPSTIWKYPVTMRTTPTVTLFNDRVGGTAGEWNNGAADGSNARVLGTANEFATLDNTAVPLTATSWWLGGATASAEL
jgi:hypothetical protein